MKQIIINHGLTDNYTPISQSIPTFLGSSIIYANTLYTSVKLADGNVYFTNRDDYRVIAYNPYKKLIRCYQDFNRDLFRERGDVLETLNDYLLDQRCNSQIKKKVSSGQTLLDEAISYCQAKLGVDVAESAYALARENKLIGIVPDDITLQPIPMLENMCRPAR